MTRIHAWPSRRPWARSRLICFSYSGAGTAPFRSWAPYLPDHMELDLYCYPGREIRSDEPLTDSWHVLLADAIEAVESVADRPYALFGHSFGAWLAFETAVHMERGDGWPPAVVVASAADAPVDWQPHNLKPPTARDSDEELLGWLLSEGQLPAEIAEYPELADMALALIRADLTAAAKYRYRWGTVTRAPITVLYGRDDPDVDHAVASRWGCLSRGAVTIIGLPGGHFYTSDIWSGLPSYLTGLADLM